MAEIFLKPKGKRFELEKYLAYRKDVQGYLETVTTIRGHIAETKLESHEHEGHSRIQVEKGKVDHYVILDDERGLLAAMSIEFGRKLPGGGHTEPVHALHDAFPEFNWSDV